MAKTSLRRRDMKESLLFNPGPELYDPPLVENFEAPWIVILIFLGTFLVQLSYTWLFMIAQCDVISRFITWIFDSPLSFHYAHPSAIQLITAIFSHASWEHWYGNMLYLCLFGIPLEKRIGHLPLLLCLLAAGIGSGLAQIFWYSLYFNPFTDIDNGTLGASGAIVGVMAFYLAIVLKTKERKSWNWRSMREHPVKILQFTAVIVILWTLIREITEIGAKDNICHAAHLGGFAMGLTFYVIWNQRVANPLSTPA